MAERRFDLQFDKNTTGTHNLLPDFGKYVLVNHKGKSKIVGLICVASFVRYPSGIFSANADTRAENKDFCVTLDFNSEDLWLQFCSLLSANIQKELTER